MLLLVHLAGAGILDKTKHLGEVSRQIYQILKRVS